MRSSSNGLDYCICACHFGLRAGDSAKRSRGSAEWSPPALPIRCRTSVGFRHADDCAILDFLSAGEPKLLDLSLRQLDQISVGAGPQVIMLEYEIFHTQAGLIGVWNHRRRPIFEVLDAPNANAGLMNIDPVVGHHVLAIDDQADD